LHPVDPWLEELAAVAARHARTQPLVRGQCVPYFRRGVLSVPAFKWNGAGDPTLEARAQSLRHMAKASQWPVDALFFDLEDAAPDQPQFKALARQFCADALRSAANAGRVLGFRPNDIRSPYFADDLRVVLPAAGAQVDFVVLPKTESADEVRDVAALVREAAARWRWPRVPRLEVLIESPRALLQAEAIAAVPEVAALVFGAYDFSRCIGSEVDAQTWLTDQAAARQWLPVVAAAHGKEALDAVTATLPIRPKDPTAPTTEERARHTEAIALCARDATDAARLGYAGKWVLHPDQVDPIQRAFSPDAARARRALDLCAAYARAAMQGSGAERDEATAGRVRLVDKAVAGMEFWVVQAGLRAGVIGAEDLARAGFSADELRAATIGRGRATPAP